MHSSDDSIRILFSRKVLWITLAFLATAMIVTTSMSGFPGLFMLLDDATPERTNKLLWTYLLITIVTAATEGAFLLCGFCLVRKLMKRVTSLTDEMKMLTRSVLHDISAPVSHIKHKIDSLDAASGDLTQLKADITTDCNRILHVVRLSSEISRTYEGLDHAGAKCIDFKAIVQDAYEIFDAVASEKGITLSCKLPPEDVKLVAHTYRLQRIVGNLLDNAIKFTPAGGTISIQLSVRKTSIRLSVSDTGIGISPSEKAKIFERFYRADKARHTPGFGLGLTLVHAIVCFYNGQISVKSKPGQGTTIEVTLPTESQPV